MSFCCQPSLRAGGRLELLQLQAPAPGAVPAAWGNPGCPRFSAPCILAQKATQHDLGTGHDMNAKQGMKGVCVHAMGFPSSRYLLVLQIHTEQELCGTPFHVSTESKSFSM